MPNLVLKVPDVRPRSAWPADLPFTQFGVCFWGSSSFQSQTRELPDPRMGPDLKWVWELSDFVGRFATARATAFRPDRLSAGHLILVACLHKATLCDTCARAKDCTWIHTSES